MMASIAYALTTWETAAWASLAAIGLLGSALYSGLETGIYRLNRIRLHLRVSRSDRNALLLSKMTTNPNRMLGSLLIGNNVANYSASMGITALLEAASLGEWQIIGITAILLTPLLFVFGEVLPKDFFQNFTDRATYRFARFLWYTQKLLLVTGLLPVTDLLSRGIAWALGASQEYRLSLHPRRVVTKLIQEGAGTGVISLYQSDIINRVLHPTERRVVDAMVPWDSVIRFRIDQPIEAFWSLVDRSPHSRFPITDRGGKPIGFVHLLDVMVHHAEACPPLETIVTEAPQLPKKTSLREALVRLQEARTAMGFVVDSRDHVIGIVTAKDLVEPIVGELDVW
jgi:putative hemolysin